MPSDPELRREIADQRRELTNAVADLRKELDHTAERGCLPLQLGAGELKLELDERPRGIGDALGGVGESVHGVLFTTTEGP